jgi:hypothetical protein
MPLHLHLIGAGREEALEVVLHEWRPDGAAYDGVPADLAEAAVRRADRSVTRRVSANEIPPLRPAPKGAMTPHSLDLRYVPA